MRNGKVFARRLPQLLFASLAFSALAHAAGAPATAHQVARATYTPTVLLWQPQIAYRSATLRVAGPQGFVRDMDFGTGQPAFSIAGLVDGTYTYEVTLGRVPDRDLAKALAGRRDDGGSPSAIGPQVESLSAIVSGTFLVSSGRIVAPDLPEPEAPAAAKASSGSSPIASMEKLIVVADDESIQGSLCVGIDCTASESFGFDTIRLKENNLRITFQDTSTSAGFPNNVWTLTANDSASGGANKFSIDDVTGAKTPFTVMAGAPTNSLFVSNIGKLGIRTNSPALDLSIKSNNTPAVRMEQDTSGGFTAQTWDIGANEANFFVRDVTGGSRLPLRIRPGALTSSIDISSTGNVGIGSSSSNLGSAARALTVSSPGASTGGSAEFAAVELSGAQTGSDGAFGVVRFYNSTTLLSQIAAAREGADTSSSLRFLTATTGTIAERMRIMPNGNVGIGTTAPAATFHVVGNARVAGNLVVTGTCCGPDYVFDPSYDLKSIDEQAEYMRTHRHLPAVGPARTTEDGQAIINVFEQSRGILEELEKAHLYIEGLHREIEKLKAQAAGRDADLAGQLAAIRSKLGL